MVFLPEAVDYIGESKQQSIEMAEDLNGTTISKYRDLAKQLGIWLSIGGFHQKVSVFVNCIEIVPCSSPAGYNLSEKGCPLVV